MNTTQLMDLISFSVTIGLGVISAALAIFAIWLSRHFDDKTSRALDQVREISSHIKSLTDASVSQQKDFSTKMLDSILSSDRYGSRETSEDAEQRKVLQEVVRKQLSETEGRITDSVEVTIRNLLDSTDRDPMQLQRAITSIRDKISQLTDEAATTISSPVELPAEVKRAITQWYDHPAHFPILAAIVWEEAKSQRDLEDVRDKYHFPGGFEKGTENILSSPILEGSLNNFSIPSDLKQPLRAWVTSNRTVLNDLIDYYAGREKEGKLTDVEREIARRLRL